MSAASPSVPSKVALFIESGGPGGAESVVLRLALGLRERGLEVAVLTTRTGWLTETLHQRGIAHRRVDAGGRLDATFPFRLARVLRQLGAEVLHSHLLDSNFYGAAAARLARIPHVATEHGDVHHTQSKRFPRIKVRTLRLLGSRMTAVSRFTCAALERLGAPHGAARCVGNPLEPPPPLDAAERKALRRSVGIEDEAGDHWLWLHVANLRPVKDQETLLRGFAAALPRTPVRQTLCLLGDGPERPALERLAAELGIEPSVHFLGFRDDVPRWLRAGDGFVLSSRSEAMPMSLLEAAGAGLLPVCTDVGGIGEVVTPGEPGHLVPAGEPDRLADALCAALADREGSRARVEALQQRVAERFSLAAVLDAYLALYAGGA